MYFVYVIVNEKGQIYIGYTSELEKRLERHNTGGNESTKGHKWRYAYYEAYFDRKDAVFREKRLKSRGQSKRQLKARIVHGIQTVK